MGNKCGNNLPLACGDKCADLRGADACQVKVTRDCEWRPQLGACECREDFGGPFFNDDDVLLERLEAASHGDRLLTKLHVNVALFSTTAADIVEGLLTLTQRQLQAWRGEEQLLRQTLHEGLQTHARPPVSLMKALQWVYRVEEMPSPAAAPARHCVLQFFSTMLAAAAALKWQRSPPAVWRQKGVEAEEVLRAVEARMSEVIAGLRFLACVALLQHCADPAFLGNTKTMRALIRATGVKLDDADEFQCSPGTVRPITLKADAAWDLFFTEARRRPADAVVTLLQDLQCLSPEGSPARSVPGGPSHFAPPLVPAAVLDTWDDEVVSGTFEDLGAEVNLTRTDTLPSCGGTPGAPSEEYDRCFGVSTINIGCEASDAGAAPHSPMQPWKDNGVQVVVPL
mmetsp:Transcript_80023/g.138901  ORF Transcript_80023/g.138901 Transcript_80023/m.138901 type:complete len:398 (+) Transcript_80023:86-1279(+)